MQIALMLIAGYVAANLVVGNGPKWEAITLYWLLLTVKNALEVKKNDSDRH